MNGSAPTVEFVRDLDAARRLSVEWEELADACGSGPFARPDHALAWWEHLGKGKLLVVVVREDGRLVALAPLHERRRGPVRAARWLGHGLGSISEALVRPGHESAAAHMWRELATPLRVLELLETKAGSPGLAELTAPNALPGRRVEVEVRDQCPITAIEGDGLDVVRRTGGRNLRKQLKSAEKNVDAAGVEFSVEVATGLDRFNELLPDIRSVFDLAEAAQPRQHLLEPPYDGFVLGFLRTAIPKGDAVAFVGYLGAQPVSFNLAFKSCTTLSLWIARFDPEYSSCRPGQLLTRHAFTYAATQGLTRVDQLLGLSQYKRQWSDDTYDTLEITAGTPRALRALSATASGTELARTTLARVRS